MKTKIHLVVITLLVVGGDCVEIPQNIQSITVSEAKTTVSITDALLSIMHLNGVGFGDTQDIIHDFLNNSKSDTIIGADAKFILKRTPALPAWMSEEQPANMPISEADFSNYYYKVWRNGILEKTNELTPFMVFILSTYYSKSHKLWKDENLKKVFSEDIKTYKQKHPNVHVWFTVKANGEIVLRKILSKDFPL